MRSIRVPLILLALVALVSFGCSGQDGATGPMGPQGPQGPQGPGAQSITFTLASIDFSQLGTNTWICDRSLPEITAAIASNGAVLCYWKSASSFWLALPWTSDDRNLRRYYHYDTGTIRFVAADYNTTPANQGAGTWRVVVVSGVDVTSLARVDVRDYAAVKKALDLED